MVSADPAPPCPASPAHKASWGPGEPFPESRLKSRISNPPRKVKASTRGAVPAALFGRKTSVDTVRSHRSCLPVRGLRKCAAATCLPEQTLQREKTGASVTFSPKWPPWRSPRGDRVGGLKAQAWGGGGAWPPSLGRSLTFVRMPSREEHLLHLKARSQG